MGMLFLASFTPPASADPSSSSSKWRSGASTYHNQQAHQPAPVPTRSDAAHRNRTKSDDSSSLSSSSSFPHSAPDLTMTLPSSSPAAHHPPSSPSHNQRRNKKRTSQFLLFLGCLILVLFLLRKDERRVVVLVRNDEHEDGKRNGGGGGGGEVVVVDRKNRSKSSSSPKRDGKVANNGKSQKNNRTSGDIKPIRQISILGERNSGTRWTYDHMYECFGHAVHVTKRFTRYKHWFQFPDPTKYPHDTLVLAQFRNPYDWLKAMEHVPHHSPNHLRTRKGASVHDENAVNDWRVFLSKPWTMPRVGADLLLDPDNATCQEDFHYRDIVSCVMEPLPPSYYNWTNRYSEHQPFYEMRNDGSGLPYENILELRTDKIRNFLTTANYPGVADTWVIQYEYLLSTGTQHLVDKVEEWTGIKPRCDPVPPQNRKQKKSRYVSPEFAAYVRKHLNWTVESWIGYEVDPAREEDQAW